MSIVELYLIFLLPQIGKWFGVVGFILVVISIMVGIIVAVGWEELESTRGRAVKTLKITIITGLCFTLINAVIPRKDTIKYIIGGYVVTNIDGIEKLPKNLVNAANEFLEGQKPPNDNQ